MRGGLLRHKLLIQTFSQASRDTSGHYDKRDDDNWSTDATGTVWGRVEPLSGRELEEARKLVAVVTHRITLRYVGSLTTDKRIKFGSRIFSIERSLNDEERNVQLQVLCVEQV